MIMKVYCVHKNMLQIANMQYYISYILYMMVTSFLVYTNKHNIIKTEVTHIKFHISIHNFIIIINNNYNMYTYI